jgi:diphthamide biosynthesis enzyme Dph1/Dph2-like protein
MNISLLSLKVALQFPDDLMKDAVSVTTRLETLLPTGYTVFILGDTSYGRSV